MAHVIVGEGPQPRLVSGHHPETGEPIDLVLGDPDVKAKAGLLELAKQLGSVTQACRVMGYSRDSFHRFRDL